ncbi:MAG: hypothetical protein AAGH83_02930 [Pseudomonadota bacterium]
MRTLALVPIIALLAGCTGSGLKLAPVPLQFVPNSSKEVGYCAALLERAQISPETLAMLPPAAQTTTAASLLARAPSQSEATNTYNVTRIEGLPVLTSPVIVAPDLMFASFQEAAMTCAGRYLTPPAIAPDS